MYSVSDDSGAESSEVDVDADKENVAAVVSNKSQTAPSRNSKGTKVSARGTKGAKYGAKDLLILSQAFIQTSENPIKGAFQPRHKFWDDVALAYSQLKKQQEAYDNRQRKKAKYTKVLLKGEFLSRDDEEDGVEVLIPVRTASSLQQKWLKFVQPLVTKFVALSIRHPKKSGEGKRSSLTSFLFFSFCFTNFFFY